MRKIILVLTVLFFFNGSIAQKSATKEIKEAIAKEFNKWLKKSDFETNADYEKRVKIESEASLAMISQNCIKENKERILRRNYRCSLEKYDAENGIFPIVNRYLEQTFYLKVNRAIAQYFAESVSPRTGYSNIGIEIVPLEAEIISDKWQITQSYIVCLSRDCDAPMMSDMEFFRMENGKIIGETNSGYYGSKPFDFQEFDLENISDVELLKQPDKKCFYTKWDIKTQPNYTPSISKPIAFSLEDLNITLPAELTSGASNAMAKSQEPDLDISKVQTINSNPNAVAVVIGNKEYENTKKVSFATNDASEVKKYLINVLGYSESNIIYIENAKKSNFDILFGTNELSEGKLFNSIKQGESDVFIYYSGHGAPGLKDNKGYFVPVDCDPNYMEQTGYSLDLFYKNLAKLNAKSVTVVTDACFSGAELFKNISPIIITVSNPIVLTPNCVILSSSTGSQVSSWFNDKNHGLFTYFFLRAMQDKEKCDVNKDNKLTFKEIADYVSDKTQGVPSLARKLHNVDQNPTIQGTGVENVFVEYN